MKKNKIRFTIITYKKRKTESSSKLYWTIFSSIKLTKLTDTDIIWRKTFNSFFDLCYYLQSSRNGKWCMEYLNDKSTDNIGCYVIDSNNIIITKKQIKEYSNKHNTFRTKYKLWKYVKFVLGYSECVKIPGNVNINIYRRTPVG